MNLSRRFIARTPGPFVGLVLILLLASCARSSSTVVPSTTAPLPTPPSNPTAALAPSATAASAAVQPRPASLLPTAAPTSAPSPAATSGPVAASTGQTLYRDPAGRFTLPVPTNWRAEETGRLVILHDPDDAIKVYAVVIPGEDMKKAIADAWAIADPSFSLSPAGAQEAPSAPGIDQTVMVDYAAGDQRMVVALGQRAKDQVYVLLFDGPLDAIGRRGSQLQVIQGGLAVAGSQRVDLAAITPKTLAPELLSEFEAYISEAMSQAHIPGAAVAVVQNGQVAYLKGFGVRELGRPDPVTPDTLMMIGSTGKTMTTMMMATVVDDQQMDWDTPAVKILPGFAVADQELTPKITMRNLVCACTGVPRRDLPYIFNANSLTAEDVVASLRTIQFLTAFGEAHQYSNQMVAAGGYLAAVAGGGRADDLYAGYLEQMQKRVFDPIGMPNTTFDFEKVAASPDHASPHGVSVLGEYSPLAVSDEQVLNPVSPAGGTWSTARDMARYLITELSEGVSPDGARVVSAENLRLTWEPQVAVDADTDYALGWMVEKYKGLRVLYHPGNTTGFSAAVALLPNADLGIVILSNARYATAFTDAIRYRLFELAYGQPADQDVQFKAALEAAAKNAEEARGMLKPAIDPAQAAPILGKFTNEELGEITFSMAGEKLVIDAGEFGAELRPVEAGPAAIAFVAYDGMLMGTVFEVRPGDGAAAKPAIVLHRLAETYTFTME